MNHPSNAPEKKHHDCCQGSEPKATEVKDPVCGMDVDPNDSAGSHEHGGQVYHFCSEGCLEAFKENPKEYLDEAAKARKAAAVPADAVHICPMHPEVKQVGPGSCPLCGMALEPLEVSLDDDAPNPELVDFSKRLKASAIFTVPLFILAMGEMVPGNPFHDWLPGNSMNWTQFLLSIPVVVWAG